MKNFSWEEVEPDIYMRVSLSYVIRTGNFQFFRAKKVPTAAETKIFWEIRKKFGTFHKQQTSSFTIAYTDTMAKDSKAKVKKVKNSKDSKPKSNNSGISKSEPFAPEAHPFIKKLAANGTYTPLSSLVPV